MRTTSLQLLHHEAQHTTAQMVIMLHLDQITTACSRDYYSMRVLSAFQRDGTMAVVMRCVGTRPGARVGPSYNSRLLQHSRYHIIPLQHLAQITTQITTACGPARNRPPPLYKTATPETPKRLWSWEAKTSFLCECVRICVCAYVCG